MKKIFFLILLSSTFTLCTKAQNYEGKIPKYGSEIIPISSLFTKENVSLLCSRNEGQVSIYNDRFEVYKKFEDLNGASRMYFSNIDQNTVSTSSLAIIYTQTLFNDDDKFEYISIEADDDSGIIKFNVCSEDNSIISSIKPEEGYQFAGGNPSIYLINGGVYLALNEIDKNNGGNYCAFYKLDKSTTNIKHVARMPLTVSPTIANQSETITVELEDNHRVREITIVNAAGQVIKNIPVSPEQRIVNFSAQDLNHGLNIVNAPSGGNNNSFKIIIK